MYVRNLCFFKSVWKCYLYTLVVEIPDIKPFLMIYPFLFSSPDEHQCIFFSLPQRIIFGICRFKYIVAFLIYERLNTQNTNKVNPNQINELTIIINLKPHMCCIVTLLKLQFQMWSKLEILSIVQIIQKFSLPLE